MKKYIAGGVAFFTLYSLFWIYYFDSTVSRQQELPEQTVLSSQVISREEQFIDQSAEAPQLSDALPFEVRIPVEPRRQQFNLSCEFAAAAAVIYHFSRNGLFAPASEEQAEKALMQEVGLSENPNIGIRMGTTYTASLFQNLSQRFGGTEYYGVHAPPFIDLFAKYGLKAEPIFVSPDTTVYIQKALSLSHLIIAWVKIGYGSPIDIQLSYGARTPIIRGEHAVVVHGYDASGVLVMDPGIGALRHIAYQEFLQSVKDFPVPLLVVRPFAPGEQPFEFDPTGPTDKTTYLDRRLLTIAVLVGSQEGGSLNRLVTILNDFGYRVVRQERIASDSEGVQLRIKKKFTDYLSLLKKDLRLAEYIVATDAADLPEEEKEDAVVYQGF